VKGEIMQPISEDFAAAIFTKAIKEHKAAELLELLFEGGSVTLDHNTGDLVMISADLLDDILKGY